MLYRCAATYFNHIAVYLRPFGYVKTKITFRTPVTGGQTEIWIFGVTNAFQILCYPNSAYSYNKYIDQQIHLLIYNKIN